MTPFEIKDQDISAEAVERTASVMAALLRELPANHNVHQWIRMAKVCLSVGSKQIRSLAHARDAISNDAKGREWNAEQERAWNEAARFAEAFEGTEDSKP